MMRTSLKRSFPLLLLTVVVLLSGCVAQRYIRTAARYEAADMQKLAVDNYFLSLQKKDKNNDKARIGLMRSSKRYADELADRIEEAYRAGNDQLVVTTYQTLKDLQLRTGRYGVELDILSRTDGQYSEASSRFLRDSYTLAQEYLDKELFSQAAGLLSQILSINSAYERAAELYHYAVCEPMYREARSDLQFQLYRSAYYGFDRLISKDPHYKDALELQKNALQGALLTIAMQPFVNERVYPNLTRQIKGFTVELFRESNNPFLRLVEPNYVELMLEEQRRALENNLAFDAAAMVPVRVHLMGSVLRSQYNVSRIETVDRKAWERYVDRNKVTRYRKVNYQEITQSCEASFRFQYQFVGVEKAAVLSSGVAERTYTDQVKYARSNYDLRDLLPGEWGEGRRDTIYTDNVRVSAMKNMFSERSELKLKQEFETVFARQTATEMLKKITAYDPEK